MDTKKFVRKVIPSSGIKTAEETYRKGRIRALQLRYGFPARNLHVIAVTGTNGKTTTCMMINAMLKSAGYKTAMFTTAVVEVAGKAEANKRHTTVPITADLLQFFQQAKEAEVDYVVLEVTSHALHQHKVLKVPIEVAVLTNFSQDHLDYHGSMDEYAAMKARLFNSYMQPSYCVLNRDDRRYKYFANQSVGLVSSFGAQPGVDVELVAAKPTGRGKLNVTLKIDGHKTHIPLNLMGDFNAQNAAAAAAAGKVLGLQPKQIAKGLTTLEVVPGRMQKVEAGQDFTVLVDYAVTPDALNKALQSLQAATSGKVLVVFGATGDRDKGKRPLMGKVVAEHADKIFLTDDETYQEDPDSIRKAVLAGIKQAKGLDKTKEIPDRKKAIKAALSAAEKHDIVFCTGLGHQDSRNMGGKLKPWDEVDIITKVYKSLN